MHIPFLLSVPNFPDAVRAIAGCIPHRDTLGHAPRNMEDFAMSISIGPQRGHRSNAVNAARIADKETRHRQEREKAEAEALAKTAKLRALRLVKEAAERVDEDGE